MCVSGGALWWGTAVHGGGQCSFSGLHRSPSQGLARDRLVDFSAPRSLARKTSIRASIFPHETSVRGAFSNLSQTKTSVVLTETFIVISPSLGQASVTTITVCHRKTCARKTRTFIGRTCHVSVHVFVHVGLPRARHGMVVKNAKKPCTPWASHSLRMLSATLLAKFTWNA